MGLGFGLGVGFGICAGVADAIAMDIRMATATATPLGTVSPDSKRDGSNGVTLSSGPTWSFGFAWN
eukprot:11182588-Lingulodinium_polyedra.AAC.1